MRTWLDPSFFSLMAQRLLEERFGLVVTTLQSLKSPYHVGGFSNRQVVWAELDFRKLKRFLGQRHGLRVLAGISQLVGAIEQSVDVIALRQGGCAGQKEKHQCRDENVYAKKSRNAQIRHFAHHMWAQSK